VNLLTAQCYSMIPAWRDALGLPFGERLRALADPQTRVRLAAGIDERRRFRESPFLDFDRMRVESVVSPTLKANEGRFVGDIARERGAAALDVFLDLAIDDRLRVCFQTVAAGDDETSWRLRSEYWQDPRVLVAGSDAGAHLDMLSTFAFYTDFVG